MFVDGLDSGEVRRSSKATTVGTRVYYALSPRDRTQHTHAHTNITSSRSAALGEMNTWVPMIPFGYGYAVQLLNN